MSVPPVHREELAGIPVYWADTPPPITAALVFRVGRVDETLPTAGISHLVEHLALFEFEERPFEVNGIAYDTTTVLHAEGSQEEVVGFLSDVAGTLTRLPLDRLEAERQILLTEHDSWAPGAAQYLMSLRFGGTAHGLTAFQEFGLHRIGKDDVERWVESHFTRGNAAVWMSGPIPPEMQLDLPPGNRVPPPPPTPLPDLVLPAYIAEGEGGIAISFLGNRSVALSSSFWILVDRARQQLRLDAGLIYEIEYDTDVLTDDLIHITVYTECRDQHAESVRDKLVQLVAELRSHGPTEDELRRNQEDAVRALADSRTIHGELDGAVEDELLGGRQLTRTELRDEIQALTRESIIEAFSAVAESAILRAPESVKEMPDGFGPLIPASGARPAGKTYRPSRLASLPGLRKRSDDLICSSDALSLFARDGGSLTIPYAQSIGLLVSAEGFSLLGPDGRSIDVEFEHFPKSREIFDEVRRKTPEDRFVRVDDSVR